MVVKVGPEQKRFKEGDKVFSFVPIFHNKGGITDFGGFQQYTLTGEATTALLPENTSFDCASTIPLALSTASDGLFGFFGLDIPSGKAQAKDEWLLVWGGASSVGQFAIQFAVASGYKVIATASKSGHSNLKKLGATEVVDYHDSDVISQILKATNDKLRLVYDAVSTKESVKLTLEALPNGGKIAYTQMSPDALGIETASNITYQRVYAGHLYGLKQALGRKVFDWAHDALKDGSLVCNPVKLRSGGIDAVQEILDDHRENGISNVKYVINP